MLLCASQGCAVSGTQFRVRVFCCSAPWSVAFFVELVFARTAVPLSTAPERVTGRHHRFCVVFQHPVVPGLWALLMVSLLGAHCWQHWQLPLLLMDHGWVVPLGMSAAVAWQQ